MAPANTLRVVELEFLASLKSWDPRVQRVLRDHLEITGLHGPWVPRGYKGEASPPGAQGRGGPKGPLGPSGQAGKTVHTGTRGPPGPKGVPGPLVRNWKQCVFPKLAEGKDTGLIKVIKS